MMIGVYCDGLGFIGEVSQLVHHTIDIGILLTSVLQSSFMYRRANGYMIYYIVIYMCRVIQDEPYIKTSQQPSELPSALPSARESKFSMMQKSAGNFFRMFMPV